MPYNRDNPSPVFRELTELYQEMHETGIPEKQKGAHTVFAGNSLLPHLSDIAALCKKTGAASILDYGSGKGNQYQLIDIPVDGRIVSSVRDYWDVTSITCYDPGVEEHSAFPDGSFDGVVCTDVLEHIPEDDIGWVLAELFSLGDKFVFANIAGYPAVKQLPNGWNAHVTIKPPEWWRQQIDTAAKGWRGSHYMFTYDRKREGVSRALAKLTGRSSIERSTVAEQ